MHLASRVGALRGGTVSHDLLDAGLILVVLVTLLAATPLILKGATDILIQERLPLWLVGLAATLSMIERLPDAKAETVRPGVVERLWARIGARKKHADRTVVIPAVRGAPATRWDALRCAGGMTVAPVPALRRLDTPLTLRLR
jgi:hypothetical protein